MNKPQLLEKYQLFIGGQWRDASDGATFTTKCPANGEDFGQLRTGNALRCGRRCQCCLEGI